MILAPFEGGELERGRIPFLDRSPNPLLDLAPLAGQKHHRGYSLIEQPLAVPRTTISP